MRFFIQNHPVRSLLAGMFLLLGPVLLAVSYSRPVPVQKPDRMREWKYIIIHHSGSSKGNEEIIQEDHLRRGMENGMAYHFLIGNGSMKLGDGEVVEGHRWKNQLQGGHCHQDYLNENGIGICLVGNFARTAPTARQEQALAKLVLRLQQEFHITDQHIHGHGDFYGEDSDCPGKKFSWNQFWEQVGAVYEYQLVNARVPVEAPKEPTHE